MAAFTISGIDELMAAFKNASSIPDDVKTRALKKMGELHAKKQKSVGESKNVRDPDSDVHILDHLKVNEPKLDKSGGSITVTFDGTRQRGNTKTRNAEIAFINEFGRKDLQPRNFINEANEAVADQSNEAALNIIHEWLQSNFE